jgi:hypothetical protein
MQRNLAVAAVVILSGFAAVGYQRHNAEQPIRLELTNAVPLDGATTTTWRIISVKYAEHAEYDLQNGAATIHAHCPTDGPDPRQIVCRNIGTAGREITLKQEGEILTFGDGQHEFLQVDSETVRQ